MLLYIGAVMLSFGAAIVGTWIISNINSKSFLLTLTELAAGFFLFFLVLDLFLLEKMSIPFIMGLYWRNNPLGAPFIKNSYCCRIMKNLNVSKSEVMNIQ